MFTSNPLVWLAFTILDLLQMAVFIWVILSLLISFNIVNRYHPFVGKVYEALDRLLDPLLRPIRSILPDLGGIDISPVILIILIQFVQRSISYSLATIF